MKGSWLGEADSKFRPFKPLVAGSSLAALTTLDAGESLSLIPNMRWLIGGLYGMIFV